MPELLDLPTELLLKVVSVLHRSQDVAAVAFTCKQLNRVASGELYERIRLHIAAPNDPAKLGVIVNLASSLFLGDPALRNSTKTIAITLPPLSTHYLPRLVSPEVMKNLHAAASADASEELARWGMTASQQRVSLADGQVWAYITLFLRACQNIRTLTLDGNFFEKLGFWDTDLSVFEELDTVELITTDTERFPRPRPSVTILASLSDVPNLRTLRLTVNGPWNFPRLWLLQAPRRSFHLFTNITVLVLWKSELNMLTIRTLLGHMPHLVTLEIDLLFGIQIESHDFSLKWCLVDLCRLRKAILGTGLPGALGRNRAEGKHCSSMLENLKISVDFSLRRSRTPTEIMIFEDHVLPEQEEASSGWDDSDSDESSDESSEQEEESDSDQDEESDSDDEDEDEENDSEDEDEDEEGDSVSYGAVYESDTTSGPIHQRRTHWEINKLGSLKRLKNLKKLEIEPMLLFGNLRSAPAQDDSDMEPERIPYWAPLDALLPDSLEEFHIACGPVDWVLLWESEWKIEESQGAGADLDSLFEMFKAYKEGGGNMPNLRKVVNTAQASVGPPEGASWDEQQMQLKNMLEDLAIDYEWSG
ncbi:hypothetical protein BFW01_g11538 [Lasiodiplodia theobromae]|nr:hypothetical protein BFW01_g11538 [Lasiodiplodia theobromae]